jgi:fermentation-respiration switch protein FrsA (DUF1100 family)
MLGRLLKPLLIVTIAGLTIPLGSRVIARKFIFPTQDVHVVRPLVDFTEHRLRARDGVEVRVLELPCKPGAPIVVHFHNNREVAEQTGSIARELAARGLGVLLVEYRGYGTSSGKPSEAGVYADAEAALDFLTARGVTPDRIVLWGTSLGTGVAAEMAKRGRGGRLVLDTPYTSIPNLVANRVPFLPADFLIDDHFDTLSKAPSIAIPTTVIHGDADEIVPFEMGQHLAATIPGARLLRIAGGHHGDLFARAHVVMIDAIAGPLR